jgi:hypothetical protein
MALRTLCATRREENILIIFFVIQISFMHKLRAVIVVILFTDISIFSNEDMLFRPFGFLAPKDM